MLPKHRRFVGFKIDAVHFNVSLPSVVEKFARQVLNDDFDRKDSAEVVAAAPPCVSAMDGMWTTRKSVMWEAFAGLPAIQTFSGHVVFFLSSSLKIPSLFEMGRYVTVVKWAEKWRVRLIRLEMEKLLAVKCGALGDTLEKSLISHWQAGTGIFAASGFVKGDVVEYYYRWLVHENMTRHQHPTKAYEEVLCR